jgi:hypothetical protein
LGILAILARQQLKMQLSKAREVRRRVILGGEGQFYEVYTVQYDQFSTVMRGTEINLYQ